MKGQLPEGKGFVVQWIVMGQLPEGKVFLSNEA